MSIDIATILYMAMAIYLMAALVLGLFLFSVGYYLIYKRARRKQKPVSTSPAKEKYNEYSPDIMIQGPQTESG